MRVWVELNPSTGAACRIFINKKAAVTEQAASDCHVVFAERARAVYDIRQAVFERDEHACVKCGQELVWERGRWNSMEMDERQAKGTVLETTDGNYQSGEVSVKNCQTLCRNCHTGIGGKHDRHPQFHDAEVSSGVPR